MPATVALLLLAAATATAAPTERLHVLMINGGGKAEENFRSHLLHVRELTTLLTAGGLPSERISVLASDGEHPAADVAARAEELDGFWRLEGTGLARWLAEPVTYESSVVPGTRLQPATRAAIVRWFDGAVARLRPGDTLLVYVTDHGTDNPRDPLDNRITLWGARESLSVRQLRAQLDRLAAGVRVVTLMSQCFSGGFAGLIDGARPGQLPSGAICGFFASTADRPAYGCYMEAAATDRIGHSFEMFDAIAASGRLDQAHAEVLVRDRTPDVPLRSSDAWAAELLRQAASAAGESEAVLVDRLLAESRRTRAGSEEVRLAERVASAFGLGSPRSLAEIAGALKETKELGRTLAGHRDLWDAALGDLTRAIYQRFLAERPAWAPRLRQQALRRLRADARRGLAKELIQALEAFTTERPAQQSRLAMLLEKSNAAAASAGRMEAREAALLRTRLLLTTAAARAHLAARGRPQERAAFAALRSCESLALPVPVGGAGPQARAPEPFATLEADRLLAGALRPSWLGIGFRPAPAQLRARLRLGAGAVLANEVRRGSPAAAAGVVPGDLVLGEVGRPFEEPSEIRAWAMLAPSGKPAHLKTVRRGVRRVVALTPAPHPGK